MTVDGNYLMTNNWAEVAIKETDDPNKASWLFHQWADGLCEEAFKKYMILWEEKHETKSKEQANPEH